MLVSTRSVQPPTSNLQPPTYLQPPTSNLQPPTSNLQPPASIILVNWNGAQHLPVCLNALRRQTVSNFEIILVDNASRDDSLALLARDFPEVKVIALQDNLGFAGGSTSVSARHRVTSSSCSTPTPKSMRTGWKKSPPLSSVIPKRAASPPR